MKIFGSHEPRTIQQLQTCMDIEPGALGVLCADGHPGYSLCIGGVIAYRDVVIPAGVGFDIACGNCAVRTDVLAADVDVPRVMDEVVKAISFGMGRSNSERIDDHPVFASIATSPVVEQRDLLASARNQLGTVGAGNHYVDVFEDRADGRLWVGVHFGSRGFGHKTASGFLAIAAGKTFNDRVSEGSMDSVPLLLLMNTPSGQDYIEAMQIAGEYAYAGRNWVVDRVLRILGAQDTKRVHNHHNFAWKEVHGDAEYWVIRKGATPAFPWQEGFIGGTMGEDAVIVRGLESPTSREALYSTVHGAGRVMSRTQAAGKQKWTKAWVCGMRDCDGALPIFTPRNNDGSNPKCPKCGARTNKRQWMERLKTGAVDWPKWQAEMKARGIELRGAGADEAPECYKRLPEVLAYHAGTIEILHTLRPIGVAMAGPDVEDLFRD